MDTATAAMPMPGMYMVIFAKGGKVSNWGKVEVKSSHFSNSPAYVILFERSFIVDLRINETLQTGAVGNRTYRVGLNAVRLETAPTGLG